MEEKYYRAKELRKNTTPQEKKLVIELDGGQHNETENIIYDKKRTDYLEANGYKVIRFWNNDIDNNIEGVYEYLLNILEDC